VTNTLGLQKTGRELLVTEIFHSLQGETSLVGVPFSFIRLTGCDLRCSYCDTQYAFSGGTRMSVDEIVQTLEPFHTSHVLITGGEPILQKNTPELCAELVKKGYLVSIETHGEISIEPIKDLARVIMDIKTPGSGMCREGFKENLKWLKPHDEIKFVITSAEDYSWARDLINSGCLPTREILLCAATPGAGNSGFPGVQPQWLAERILEDRLPVRFQVQLHKVIWGPDKTGV